MEYLKQQEEGLSRNVYCRVVGKEAARSVGYRSF